MMNILSNHKPFIAGVIVGSLFGFILFRYWQNAELERMYKGKLNA